MSWSRNLTGKAGRWRLGLVAALALLSTTGWSPGLQGGETDDPSAVEITQLHSFVSVSGGVVEISEYYLISNRSDQTYVGVEDPDTGERTTLEFFLPEGAEGLAFEGAGLGERFVEREQGFADTEPVAPGTASSEVLFTYQVLYEEGTPIERVFSTRVLSVLFLLVSPDVALDGDDLNPPEMIETSMGSALSYTAGPFEAGETLVFSVIDRADAQMPVAPPSGMSAPSGSAPPPDKPGESPLNSLSVGLASLALALVGVYLLLIRRPVIVGGPPEQARALVNRIAELDDEFEEGGVGERAYRQRRQALKQKLIDMLLHDPDALAGG